MYRLQFLPWPDGIDDLPDWEDIDVFTTLEAAITAARAIRGADMRIVKGNCPVWSTS